MLLLVVLAGCAIAPRTAVGPRGLLEVLGPAPGFTPQALSGDWIAEGYEGTQSSELAVIRLDGVPALRIVNGMDGFLVVRRTQAMLLATPYLG